MSTVTADLNHWADKKCAKAFWSQKDLPAYRELLDDTVAWLDTASGQTWLDLGCGSGQLTRSLWEKSQGTLAGIVASDYAATNVKAIEVIRASATPADDQGRISFCQGDFSEGLPSHTDQSYDGVVSGLAIQYAQSFSASQGCWTTEAYDKLLREVFRVLKPGGQFVFSVNVPEPSWLRVAVSSMTGVFLARSALRFLRNSWRMMHYGAWLKREARRGRFHYLPSESVTRRLTTAGFVDIQYRRSFARQAYLFKARRPD